MSPEQLFGNQIPRKRIPRDQIQKVDVFALGVIFFELCYPLPTDQVWVKVYTPNSKETCYCSIIIHLFTPHFSRVATIEWLALCKLTARPIFSLTCEFWRCYFISIVYTWHQIRKWQVFGNTWEWRINNMLPKLTTGISGSYYIHSTACSSYVKAINQNRLINLPNINCLIYTIYVKYMDLASFPGPAQLFCTASNKKLGGAWERGYYVPE